MKDLNYADPRNDPRLVGELIIAALTKSDEELAWNAIRAIQSRGTREVLTQAASLCRSSCEQERILGADILGQGGPVKPSFPRECAGLLVEMLRKTQPPPVLAAIFNALGHLHAPEAIWAASRFRQHPDAAVRHAVVLALNGHDHPTAVRWLIELTRDSDSHVRDWATFALGSQTDLDSAELRDALADRLDDPDDDTRAEALMGLARRRDRRVIAALAKELSGDCVGTLAVEAAEEIGAPELYVPLVELRTWWDVAPELLDHAVRACVRQ
jgi:HEAT repeat protein